MIKNLINMCFKAYQNQHVPCIGLMHSPIDPLYCGNV